MPTVNADLLCPWDLTLTLGGHACATIVPDLAAVLGMTKPQSPVTADLASLDLEATLRQSVKQFLQTDDYPYADKARWDAIMAASVALMTYLEIWLKKKREVAREAAMQMMAANPSAASGN